MSQHPDLDCVIIGYNDLDFGAVQSELQKTQKYSGAYNNLKTNSVRLGGERVTYIDLLNRTLSAATGRAHRLHVGELPNLGVSYLKSFMSRRQFNVELINFYSYEKERLRDLLAQGPNAVAITTTFYVDSKPIADIIKFIREHSAGTRIIVGGPHIFNICSDYDEATQNFILKNIGADIYVFDSQGELTLARVLGELRSGAGHDLSRIPNLVYADGKQFRRTKREVEDNDMDENCIDWRSFPSDFYTPTVQLRTARSCAFSCSFCRYPILAGPLNLTSVDVIELEMHQLQAAGVRNVVFIDDTFNVPLPRFKDICRMMIRNGFGFDWFSYFRCSNADEESFDLMAESGCKGVFLGIESGDPSILKGMNKFANVDRYAHGIRRLKERGVATFASLILGFPGETEQTVRNSIDFIEETAPTFYRAELYYHDTKVPIHERAAEYGLTGAGYSWKHATMDWKAASQLIEEMYKSVRNSLVLPLYMFDFWSLPYLLGKGLTMRQIEEFARVAQKMLVASLDDTSPGGREYEQELGAIFRTEAALAC